MVSVGWVSRIKNKIILRSFLEVSQGVCPYPEGELRGRADREPPTHSNPSAQFGCAPAIYTRSFEPGVAGNLPGTSTIIVEGFGAEQDQNENNIHRQLKLVSYPNGQQKKSGATGNVQLFQISLLTAVSARTESCDATKGSQPYLYCCTQNRGRSEGNSLLSPIAKLSCRGTGENALGPGGAPRSSRLRDNRVLSSRDFSRALCILLYPFGRVVCCQEVSTLQQDSKP